MGVAPQISDPAARPSTGGKCATADEETNAEAYVTTAKSTIAAAIAISANDVAFVVFRLDAAITTIIIIIKVFFTTHVGDE